ncbi:SDR family NAD(P)-dependent oxidoreductase [Paenarthrobacter sp. NPDC091711]|uniref:SDR family NAD(P)-dependent oxidoreductase n=1 Tax=Paenarthrobacter sp. NPDC091711 TaxID=3364385 RepID=UPI0037F556E3
MKNTVALVTGGNRGLGRSTALALASKGAKIVVTYRSGSEAAAAVVDEIRSAGSDAIAVPLDITDIGTFPGFSDGLQESLRSRWDRETLDVLVNNAGVGLFGTLEETTEESFDALVGTNFKGTFFLIKTLVPLMSDGGRIVNVSTSLTRHASPGTSAYAASKAAVEALSRSLALELGPRKIRINAVAPGPSATDFNGGAMRDNNELRKVLASQTALGRVGHPEEIGDAIASLVSDDMRWITAERIEVSGGALL